MDRKTRSSVIWRDIVFINGEYFLEEFPVVFENPVMNSLKFSDDEEEILNMLEDYDNGIEDCIYDCSDFFDAIRKKYDMSEDEEVLTYMFDEFDLPDEICKKYDVAILGGYINGFNI